MKTYKIGDTINFRARINGNPASDNPTAIVYDETDTVEATLTIGAGLTQVGSTKIIKGSFTPDANGIWSIHLTDDQGLDIVKQFIVGTYSLETIGGLAATLESKIDAQDLVLAAQDVILGSVDGKIDIQDALLAVMDGKLDSILGSTSGGAGHFG